MTFQQLAVPASIDIKQSILPTRDSSRRRSTDYLLEHLFEFSEYKLINFLRNFLSSFFLSRIKNFPVVCSPFFSLGLPSAILSNNRHFIPSVSAEDYCRSRGIILKDQARLKRAISVRT
ncbi:hypothetical protein ANTQUA_LOCUS1465 [Anthophora quadrimaculata]